MSNSSYIAIAEAVELAKTHRAGDKPRAIALARSYNYNMPTWWSYTGANFFGSKFFIFGMIADGAEHLIEAMEQCQGRVTILIDCAGGDTNTALKIGRWLAAQGRCTAIVTGRCESAANLILAGCARRCAVPGAGFMLHAIKLATCGTAPQLRAQANALDGYVAEAVEFLAARTGQPINHVSALLTGPEFNFNTAEAVAFNLIHEVASEDKRANGALNLILGNADTPPAPYDDALAYELARALCKLRIRDPQNIRNALPYELVDRPAQVRRRYPGVGGLS